MENSLNLYLTLTCVCMYRGDFSSSSSLPTVGEQQQNTCWKPALNLRIRRIETGLHTQIRWRETQPVFLLYIYDTIILEWSDQVWNAPCITAAPCVTSTDRYQDTTHETQTCNITAGSVRDAQRAFSVHLICSSVFTERTDWRMLQADFSESPLDGSSSDSLSEHALGPRGCCWSLSGCSALWVRKSLTGWPTLFEHIVNRWSSLIWKLLTNTCRVKWSCNHLKHVVLYSDCLLLC